MGLADRKNRYLLFIALAVLLAASSVSPITLAEDLRPYPEYMLARYAGTVKPQRDVVDYTGNTIANQYSTVYLGNYSSGSEGSGSHPGADITQGDCQLTPIRAVAGGTVREFVRNWLDVPPPPGYPPKTVCGNNDLNGYGGLGNYVLIEHDNIPHREGYGGTTYSAYGHLASVNANLDVGGKVLRGTVIGLQGSTGGSTGPHLHYQMDRNVGESTFGHPYWPFYQGEGPNDNNPSIQNRIIYYTFNPMRFVQAHLIDTAFIPPGAWAQYIDEHGIIRGQFHEAEIDHEWFFGAPPVPNIYGDDFSAQWEGTIDLLSAGSWIFYVSVDDGARLWLDGELVFSSWSPRIAPDTFEVQRDLSKGQHWVSLQYFEAVRYATIQLAWQEGPRVFIPLVRRNP